MLDPELAFFAKTREGKELLRRMVKAHRVAARRYEKWRRANAREMRAVEVFIKAAEEAK